MTMHDEECGCETATAPTPAASPPIACSLDAAGMGARVLEWESVLASVERRAPVVDGLRLTFGQAAPLAEISRLMAAEHACCPFFSFDLTIDGRGIALEVRAPADGQPLLDEVFGSPAG